MKLNLGCGPHKLDGFENLDATEGWRFEDGLPYPDNSVDGITISHSLMYVKDADYPKVFGELYRVLAPGGTVRITEDDAENPQSIRFGGWVDAKCITSPRKTRNQMLVTGFHPVDVEPDETCFRDNSLIQHWHGMPPKVFFMEGIKPACLK